MTEKALLTRICPRCKGRKWAFYPKVSKYWLVCKKCKGSGFTRYKITLPKSHKTIPQRIAIETIEEKRLNDRNRVANFKQRNPDRWNEIQKKYRSTSNKFKDYFRKYLRDYRAKKHTPGKRARKPKVGRPEILKETLCVKCGKYLPKPNAKGFCVFCVAEERKKLLLLGELLRKEDVLALRDEEKMTFSEIGRTKGVSRQRAFQMYQEAKESLTTNL